MKMRSFSQIDKRQPRTDSATPGLSSQPNIAVSHYPLVGLLISNSRASEGRRLTSFPDVKNCPVSLKNSIISSLDTSAILSSPASFRPICSQYLQRFCDHSPREYLELKMHRNVSVAMAVYCLNCMKVSQLILRKIMENVATRRQDDRF